MILLLGTIFITFLAWEGSEPYSYTTYSYEVICQNGKRFDPTSKPINEEGSRSLIIEKTYLGVLRTFNESQIKSECEYGCAYFDWELRDKPKNYELNVTPKIKVVYSKKDQVINTALAFILSNILLQIIRRAFLYVFFGKNFLTLKPMKNKE